VKKSKTKKKISMTLIIPVLNEEKAISKKIKNTLELLYPRKLLQVIIIDGGSKDKTVSIIKKYSKRYKHINLIYLKQTFGKLYQVNRALKKAKGEIIVISDADATLSKNSMLIIAEKLQTRDIGCVGLCTIPRENTCSPEELEYWILNSKLRFLESNVDSAFSTIATCYAFKKKLLKQFPKDVIADDLYTTFKIREKGYRVIYTPDAVAYEERAAKNVKTMLKHKFRKAIADIHEFRRFNFKLLSFSGFGSLIYPTRILQFFIAPIMSFIFMILSLYFLFSNTLQVFLFFMLIGFLFLANSYVFSKVYHPPIKIKKSNPIMKFSAIILSNVVLIIALLLYPFAKKSSKYKRI